MKIVNSIKAVFLETFNKLIDILKPFSSKFSKNSNTEYSDDRSTVYIDEVFLETFNKLIDILKPLNIPLFKTYRLVYSDDHSTLCIKIHCNFYELYLNINVDQSIELVCGPNINFSSFENKVFKFNSIEDAKEDIIKCFLRCFDW